MSNTSATPNRLLFFDFIRNAAMLGVILYHAVAAYTTVTPYWSVHDGASFWADGTRQVLEVFIMPVFFFVAGYFALPSLQKKGLRHFLADKLKRLGLPWLLAILVVVPLVNFGGLKVQPAFWNYWAHYVGSVGTFQLGPRTLHQVNQMHFWYLSLLLSFFILWGGVYQLATTIRGTSGSPASSAPASAASILRGLLIFGGLVAAVYFVTLRLFPDASWAELNLLLEFQPTRLLWYAAYFALGLYACARQWFARAAFPGRPAVWGLGCLVLGLGYLGVGQGVFTHPADSQTLSPALLAAFALVRSFFGLAGLGLLAAFALRYANRPLGLNQELAAHSFNIYLVHLFPLVILQDMLEIWPGGPILVKVGLEYGVTLLVSYGASRLIHRFPRGFAAGLVGLFALVTLMAH